MDELIYERDGHVGIITLNRPDKLNALTPAMMQQLDRLLDEINLDDEVRCLVITGAGERAFSVGFDLDGLEMPDTTPDLTAAVDFNFRVILKIRQLRIPAIAAVNGYAVAAGSNLAMICDITIASEQARFGEPEIRHGALSPMLLLPWFNGNPKMIHYLYYSGDTIGAQQALSLGMIANVVPAATLRDEAVRMARRIAMVPPYAVRMTKDSLRRTYEIMGFANAQYQHKANDTLVLGARGIPEKDYLFGLMESGDMRAFLEARDGPFKKQ
ncbi:MAG TPA: enoyl-CoA hydratase/isomerase family protein [Roseiflexaceae bacterium]|nr:enoyl-CoA hydratase/isomerase family protein [Roseiflexaceae bacterium]